jgi:MarR family transcriptional regulator, organic hydroperoxide resistance regulator
MLFVFSFFFKHCHFGSKSPVFINKPRLKPVLYASLQFDKIFQIIIFRVRNILVGNIRTKTKGANMESTDTKISESITPPAFAPPQMSLTESTPDRSFYNGYGMRILRSLRKIMRAVDIHSRRLNVDYKITAPQMICLVALEQAGPTPLSALAKLVNLAPSTITGILDRLEQKHLVQRIRSEYDRRKILLHLTPQGEQIIKDAPILLQDKLSQSVSRLPQNEQASIAQSLEKLIHIMELDHLDASPNLIQGTLIADENLKGGDHAYTKPPRDPLEPNH